MKHVFNSLLLLTLISMITFSFVGCDQESLTSRGSVTIRLAAEERLLSRTILPDASALDITSYTISGVGPNGVTLSSTTSSNSSITFNNLLVGNWTFSASAHNSSNKVIASGEVSTYIVKNQNTIDLPLVEVAGDGTLSLTFEWESSQVETTSTFSVTIYDESNGEVSGTTVASDMSNGDGSLSATLAAGFYRVEASLMSQGVRIAGFSESVRIIAGTSSSANINLVIGKIINGVNLTITDNRFPPVMGSITRTAGTLTVGQELSLTYSITTPSGDDESAYNYIWYVDGVVDPSSTSHVLSVNSALGGTTRYDVVVVKKESSIALGSASIDVVIEVTPTIAP
ncbi:MAG: hypothetical protein EOM67_06375 [Spirochaetia bacterium]|nr:hypothetical protein [Spirochaetia bacterium]